MIAVLTPTFSGQAHAQGGPPRSPPALNASAYLLMDHKSGVILAEKNADQRLPPASLTKIMLSYIAAMKLKEGVISLDDEVSVSEKAWRMRGSRMFIEVGKKVPLRDILKGIIIQSGNDASVALAEHISGSEEFFVAEMNEAASRLGLSNTHFIDSSGLGGEDHYSSARDIAILSASFIRSFPEIYGWHAIKEYTYNDIKQHNRNRLLFIDERVDGIKTGHTEVAAYCLSASAVQDGMRLVSVVMGAVSSEARTQESQALLNYGFGNYKTALLYADGQPVAERRVWKGDRKAVEIGVAHDVHITLLRGEEDRYERKISISKRLLAPIHAGQAIGTLQIRGTMGGDFQSFPLVALHDVPKGSLVRRVEDSILMMLE